MLALVHRGTGPRNLESWPTRLGLTAYVMPVENNLFSAAAEKGPRLSNSRWCWRPDVCTSLQYLIHQNANEGELIKEEEENEEERKVTFCCVRLVSGLSVAVRAIYSQPYARISVLVSI